jgi:hypothetical protein
MIVFKSRLAAFGYPFASVHVAERTPTEVRDMSLHVKEKFAACAAERRVARRMREYIF